MFGKELRYCGGAILMDPVGSPCGDDHFTAIGGIKESLIVFRAIGIRSGEHLFRIGGAKAEDVGHQKPVETLALGKPANARKSGVERLLIGRARVESDPHDQAITEQRIDAVQQRVAMLPVG